MAGNDLRKLASHPGVELVAVAEVDLRRAARVREEFPGVRIYQDWRELLAAEGDGIDSCNVSTPDHMHAPMAMAALRRGIHVYGQKPLTHQVAESRALGRAADRAGLVTQMGTQLASYTSDLTAVAWIRAGAIGRIREVHTFTDKTWGDPAPRPERSDPVPPELDWNGWNGVAKPPVAYVEGHYHPVQWRKRRAFGTGTLGDMGCHLFHGWYRALELAAPLSLRSLGPAPNAWNWAVDGEIRYRFAGTRFTAGETVDVTWYEGAKRPPPGVVDLTGLGDRFPVVGSLYVGEDGVLLHPHGGWVRIFRGGALVEAKDHGYREVAGRIDDHWNEFVGAIRGEMKNAPKSPFGFAGPLTEAVLLGTVATIFPGEELRWDDAGMRFSGRPDADAYLRRDYRDGWEVPGLP